MEAFLQTLAGGNPEAMLRARIARRGYAGISMSRLIAETGWTRGLDRSSTGSSVERDAVLRIGDLFAGCARDGSAPAIHRGFRGGFHKKNSLVGGIAREALREQVKASPEVFTAALDMLVRGKKIEIAGDVVRLPGHGVVMKDEEAESKKKIEDAFAVAGLKVPALHEVIAGLKVDKARAQKIVTLLLRDKVLVKISDELVFHRSALERIAAAESLRRKRNLRRWTWRSSKN